MKAKDEARLSTLRMVKSALQLKGVEKMAPLDDKESQAVLATLIKQRKESVEQFTKGGRQEMADKEAAEIIVIESYLPKAASDADIAAGVKAAIAEMGSPTMKEMGTVMKNAMARFNAVRHARGWKSSQRDGEERTSGKVGAVRAGITPTASELTSERVVSRVVAQTYESGLYKDLIKPTSPRARPDAGFKSAQGCTHLENSHRTTGVAIEFVVLSFRSESFLLV